MLPADCPQSTELLPSTGLCDTWEKPGGGQDEAGRVQDVAMPWNKASSMQDIAMPWDECSRVQNMAVPWDEAVLWDYTSNAGDVDGGCRMPRMV